MEASWLRLACPLQPAHTLHGLPAPGRESLTTGGPSAAPPSCSLQGDKLRDCLSSFRKPFRGLQWGHTKSNASLQRSQPQQQETHNEKYLVRDIVSTPASAEWIHDVETISVETAGIYIKDWMRDMKDWMHAIYVFTRPYAILGTTLQAFSASLLAVSSTATLSSTFLIGLLQAWVAAVCVNIFTSGINEIVDVNLDKINKPYLPLASGRLSMATAILVVGICAVVSICLGVSVGSKPLLWMVALGLICGTAYSIQLPFLYWKSNSISAILCVLSYWTFGRQLGFFLHMQTITLGSSCLALTKPFLLSMGMVASFSILVAISKDICDMEGDKSFGIKTFSVQMGGERVFWICIFIIQALYATIIGMGLTSQVLWSKIIIVVCHGILSSFLWFRATRYNVQSKEDMYDFYMFVWKLFYLEHLLIPLLR